MARPLGISLITANEHILRYETILLGQALNNFRFLYKHTIMYEFLLHFQVWTSDPGRNAQLEYRLSIFYAKVNDTGSYTCITPSGNSHRVRIIVKKVNYSISEEQYIVKMKYDIFHLFSKTLFSYNIRFGVPVLSELRDLTFLTKHQQA